MANNPIKTVNLLPEFLRSDKNSKFLSGTLDQMLQPPNLERVDGFIGSKLTPTYDSATDSYIEESLKLRKNYQLEPALVVKTSGAITSVKSYDDLINELNVSGGNVENLDRLFRSNIHAFSPSIEWDKFVNYQNYYWLPTGPNTIDIFGVRISTESTYKVTDNEIKSAWIFTPNGLDEDPVVTLHRGNTYKFEVDSTYPFYIKTAPSYGTDDVYDIKVTNNGIKKGTIVIEVDENTPQILYYTSDTQIYTQGQFVIKNSYEDATIDVVSEIVGKKTYISGNGIPLSNGMKVKFGGEVYPEQYRDNEYYVEGVGTGIKLVDSKLLVSSEIFTSQLDDNFESTPFDSYPYDKFRAIPIDPDYITVSRASMDLNPWSRYNRWVHADVIKVSAESLNLTPEYPADKRAKRPIIEFKPNLKLFNFGAVGIKNVDLIDNSTTDVFSFVEGSAGYYVDGILLDQGHRVIFNADTDPLVRGKIFEVKYTLIDNQMRLELVKSDDHDPVFESAVSVNLGLENSGKSWWFDGDSWVFSQQRTKLNQPPLFELYDNSGLSYSQPNYQTSFSGCKLFGYAEGTGAVDSILGFPIETSNNVGVGSFTFKNYLASDLIEVFENNAVTYVPAASAFYKFYDNETFANAWEVVRTHQTPVLQFTTTNDDLTEVIVDSLVINERDSVKIKVYLDGLLINDNAWNFIKKNGKYLIEFNNSVKAGTNVLCKIYTNSRLTKDGWYEVPVSLTNNPLNGQISEITLTDALDHYKTMAENDPEFVGSISGANNSRDLGNLASYGNKLVTNCNPIAFAFFFIANKDHSLLNAISKSADQYEQFKSEFLKKITSNQIQNNPVDAVDRALQEINANKDFNALWYYSDMAAYGNDKSVREWVVSDSRNTVYPILKDFDTSALNLRSVLVYLNNTQLVVGRDYKFLENDSAVRILVDLTPGDKIAVHDYSSTEGAYIPPTPTKLGMYPKYIPEIFDDYTYANGPVKVIQGHDGSITIAHNDYRDEIILELEKRIFNNIKAGYNQDLFDINELVPGAFRTTDYSLNEVNSILQRDFIKWANLHNLDYVTNTTFDNSNPFTWNYYGSLNESTNIEVSGNWRSFFKYFYDTDRPHTHPWEMLGLVSKPVWWDAEYGVAPYTSGNTKLWTDLQNGEIKFAGVNYIYARPGLLDTLPVDANGKLRNPAELVINYTSYNARQNWKFGDQSPVETAWRRSSSWPFAVQRMLALTVPSLYASLMYNPSDLSINNANQWVTKSGEFLNIKNVKIFSENATLTNGYSVYVAEIGKQQNYQFISELRTALSEIDFNLFYKVGGFVNKNKIQIIIDSIDPTSTSPGAILPSEDYSLILNKSNPIKSVGASGIIVEKNNGKFVLKGYDKYLPFFTVFEPLRNSQTPAITVGGISDSFVEWAPSESDNYSSLTPVDTTTAYSASKGNFYQAGQVVKYGTKFYRVKVSHTSGNTFDNALYQSLNELPVKGGATVQTILTFSTNTVQIPYGSEFTRIQDVYDVIVGYGKWLESQGFVFDSFNSDINSLLDWNLSAKEFLYWTTQNWANGSVITLSPFANYIKYSLPNSIVDNIFDSFYDYNVLKSDGTPLSKNSLTVSRNDGNCVVETNDATNGIYFIQLNSVQKEHAIVFNNTSVFNDIVYDIETGYKQRRVKIVGFRTSEWDGDYVSPGFVYDKATVTNWKEYTVYTYGDVVKYNNAYYSAVKNISGSQEFKFNEWVLLNSSPVEDLLPNFEYKINQFEDFYSLDIDNFDAAQQKMAQHLIGYTPRVYLNNIFTNPISQYKFYQGFIKEKGTKNAVDRLAKATIHNLQGEIDFSEEWAFRIGSYGSFETYNEIELSLIEGEFVENPQILKFVDNDPGPVDLIYHVTSESFSIKPDDYSASNTFLTTNTNFKINVAGYVNFDDVTATAYNENSILDIANNGNISVGDTIWVGFTSNGDWDVLRYENSNAKVIGVFVSSPGTDITFVTDRFHNLSVGDLISVAQFDSQVNGVYKIKSIPKLDQITVASTLTSIMNSALASPGQLYVFNSGRYRSFDELPSDSDMLRHSNGTLYWIDNENSNGNHEWKVYKKENVYTDFAINTNIAIANQEFGASIAKNSASNVLLIGAPSFASQYSYGKTFVYERDGVETFRKFSVTLDPGKYHNSSEKTEFGHAVSYDPTEIKNTNFGLMFASAPAAKDIYANGTVGDLRFATNLLDNGSILSSASEGLVKISSVDPLVLGELSQLVILSPNPIEGGRFGENILAIPGTKTLLVSECGIATTGTVHQYQYDVATENTTVVNTATTGSFSIEVLTAASISIGNSVWFNNANSGLTVASIDGNVITLNTATTTMVMKNTNVKFFNLTTGVTNTNSVVSNDGVLAKYVASITNNSVGFGKSLTSSANGQIIAFGSPNNNTVEIYTTTNLVHYQTLSISSDAAKFGSEVCISDDGSYLLVSAPQFVNSDNSFGKVFVYKRQPSGFLLDQVLVNPVNGIGLQFGKSLSFNTDATELAISAVGTNTSVPDTFDEETIFDNGSTYFVSTVDNFGTAYVYNRNASGTRFVLSAELRILDDNTLGSSFGHKILLDNDAIYVSAPAYESLNVPTVYQFTKGSELDKSLLEYRSFGDTIDVETIQKLVLLDSEKEQIIEYLELFDPLKGKIPSLADQEIRYKTSFDPAVYSIGTASVVVDTTTSWLDEHVGELWWDLSSVKYVWYEQGNLSYRKNNWGKLFPGATIDVYEWVGSPYLPSEWASLADTTSGLTDGISGQPKFSDNSIISVKQVYNPSTSSFVNYYYYWVKNKVTVPAVKNRRISSYQVSAMILDPTAYGLRYVSLLRSDSLAISNVSTSLVGSNIYLNIAYDNNKNINNKHTEWLILQENSSNSLPNSLLEKKLFDSLLGHDSLGNPVPDPGLTTRTRYGISVRPRQTMFRDRKEALRNLVEFSNSILHKTQITGNFSFENLLLMDEIPNLAAGEYDQIVEDNNGLALIDTRLFKTAELSCSVKNGKIVSVKIDNQGLGYKNPPKVTINGTNQTAEFLTKIDAVGRVIEVEIKNSGYGYEFSPSLDVRPYSVVVAADATYNGKWAIFSWSADTSNWIRFRTQKFNTKLYWDYIDWVDDSYNKYIDFSYTVDNVYQLDTLEDVVTDQYVKVKNVGDNRYVILRRTNGSSNGTFGKKYDLVYKQGGTISIRDTIWNTITNSLTYDYLNNYDQTLFDQTPDVELLNILNALKNDIFVNELRVYWNLLFFKSVKYALTEQKLLDWAFKTSFINVTNYAGALDQRPVYKLQNSSYYEAYLNEVKPYHTQVRSFTTNYSVDDPSNSHITDFDLPPVYSQDLDKVIGIEEIFDSGVMTEDPWKSWFENYTYVVGSVNVGDQGFGYVSPPQVILQTVNGDTGSGATARAIISSSKLVEIVVTNPGSGYTKSPTVILLGGGGSNFTPAVAYAQLYNGKVRNNLIGIQFNRLSSKLKEQTNIAVDSFVCNGSSNEFVLNWYANPEKANISVTLDGELVLSSYYKVTQYTEKYNGYHKKYSKVAFIENVPRVGQVLEVSYKKNIEIYDAAGRISSMYKPTSGMPGVDLPQLMGGIDRPGTTVSGLQFDYSSDWDLSYLPFDKTAWADNAVNYTTAKLAFSANSGTSTLTLSTTTGISVGQFVNVISTTSGKFFTSTVIVNTLTVASSSTTVGLNSSLVSGLSTGDVVEFWNYDINSAVLDSDISGGSFSSILGFNPEDIIIDSDAFISPNVSNGTEELIPGFVADSIGINVYTRYYEGTPTIISGSHDVVAGDRVTIPMTVMPPSVSSLFVTFNNQIYKYSQSISTTVNDAYYSINWASRELILGPHTVFGKLSYTIIGVGGGDTQSGIGLLDMQTVTVPSGNSTMILESAVAYDDVNTVFVSANGSALTLFKDRPTYDGALVKSEFSDRAAVELYTVDVDKPNLVQAWFFGNSKKYFNELREEQIIVGANGTNTFELALPPGNIGPESANAIVEINFGNGFERALPPFISYYNGAGTATFAIVNDLPGSTVDYVRVFLNGMELESDTEFTSTTSTVTLIKTTLTDTDVVAVLCKPASSTDIPMFDITGGVLTFDRDISNADIRVITFTDHDSMLIKTQRFSGNPNRQYQLSGVTLTDDDHLWVTVDGIPLRVKIDYRILNENTIELSDIFATPESSQVVITTLNREPLAETVVGYRIFNDAFNRTHFKRLSKKNTAFLTKPLLVTDTEIHVSDASVLTPPSIGKTFGSNPMPAYIGVDLPGVVLINGERIEFFKVENNILSQLRRSTIGTGPKSYVPVGTQVVDQGLYQTIPYNESVKRQIQLTTNTTTYVISTLTTMTNYTLGSDVVKSDGITLQTNISVITDVVGNEIAVELNDQVEVFYGGKLLRKDGVYKHDESERYDSSQCNILGSVTSTNYLVRADSIGDAYLDLSTNNVWVYEDSLSSSSINGYVYTGLKYYKPEFEISIANTNNGEIQQIELNIDNGIQENIELVIVKKEFSVDQEWNSVVDGKRVPLLDSTTQQAVFLKDSPAMTPDYQQVYLIAPNGYPLLDNNTPLKG